ncbi:SCO-spondin-like isoform X2 [Dysidea avara]|uniref:SCO-spondin-like isoform X2 n=1 Tax=Dysidea avara TaxID=196820 RepID=UPI003328E8FC
MRSWHLLLLTAFAICGLATSTYSTGKCVVSWSSWSSWSFCNKRCGLGVQQRHRSCVSSGNCPYSHSHQDVVKGSSSDDENPTLHPSEDDIISSGDDPAEADKKSASSIEVDTSNNQSFYQSLKLLCPGRGHEIKKCFKSSCVYFTWASWGSWSGCTSTCGGYGRRYRRRKCERTYNYAAPRCVGSNQEVESCGTQCCPVDATWSSWSSFSLCSKSCGGGYRVSSRVCIKAKCGGKEYCEGESKRYIPCNTDCCRKPPYWGIWKDWSVCSKKCGGGISYRKRTCYPSKCPDPYVKKCTGHGYEEKKCNEQCCPVKPYWGDWEEWSVCNKKCGGGISYRKRKCIPSKCPYSDPRYNKCDGNDYEEKKCNEQCCPVKPYWGDWEEWTVCSKKCGGGISYRKRKCIPSKCPYSDPRYNKCYGNDYEEKKCNEQCCPERPEWSEWAVWSTCSKRCGGGFSYRRRKCIQSKCPHPYYKTCEGSGYEEKKCNEKCCPEAPSWAKWENWSVCSKKCGSGISYRRRKCVPSKCPYSDRRYNKCFGSGYEEKKCNEQCCPEKPYYGDWEEWSVCSKKCGGGISYRKRKCLPSKCPYSDPRYNKCDGNDYEEKKCNDQCCPVKPYYGDWEEWSVCSKKCGGGISYRKRKCLPSKCPYSDPRYNKCDGNDYEEKKCNDQCCPVKPYYGDWEEWSVCSKKCGGGISYRKRKCLPSKCPYSDPRYNKCDGNDYEEKKCNDQCCPVKPYYGDWEEWSVCSKKCGGGISYRKRKCLPSKCPYSDPRYNKCDGNDYEEKKCNDQCCPVKPYYGDWEEWSVCSKKCGGGISYRKRKCLPSKCPYSDPRYNKCDGNDYEEKKCNDQCCPEKPYWGDWENWSICSKKCGSGISYRKRKCLPSKCPYSDPQYNKCYGNDYEEKKCNEQCCPEKPYWGGWEEWSVCSKKCGGGISYRKRKCLPSKCPYSDPRYNKCDGSDYEEKKCNEECCPQPPSWGTWSKWNYCSKTCGGGLKNRTRHCYQSKCPDYGKCSGHGYEEAKCNEHCCPERPYWGEWENWSVCSKKCGGGVSYRKRKCIPSKCPSPYYKTCQGRSYEEKKCNEKCCPEKPYWGDWEEWSVCSKKCGGGISYRKRKCVPSKCPYSDPQHNKCYGNDYEEKKCNENCCPEKPYWGGWQEWSVCSKKCGGGISYRKRKCIPSKCPYADPSHNKCYGSDYEEKKCNEKCCPEKPHYGDWEEWSVCSKKCGGGISYRKRKCIPSKCPYADPSHNKCDGSDYEEKKCNEKCCPEKPYWGDWEEWSVCSKKCGGGISYRKRKCYQSKCPDPYYTKCDGSDYEEKKCNDQCCPEKPHWGDWEEWSVCSKKCGGGISYRKRKCIPSKCPYSDLSHNKCDGNDYEEKKCNDKCCPEPDHFGEWSTWSKCSSSCGKGKKFRKRECYQSKCPTDYRGCKGSNYEYADCDAGCCPKNGYWGSWSSWSDCSVSCGYGQQRRERKCHEPECGGKGCWGSKYSAKSCYIQCEAPTTKGDYYDKHQW